MATDVSQFLSDLSAGVFAGKVSAAIERAVFGTIAHDKKGKVTITLEFEQLGASRQVLVKHTLAYTEPTARGKVSEEDTTDTPMHVNADGSVTIFPVAQGDLFKSAAGAEEKA